MVPGKCKGCPYFDYDDQDGGEDGRLYVPVCTYKREDDDGEKIDGACVEDN